MAMRRGDLKLIYRISSNYFELYDLAADPGERRNLYDVHPEAAELRVLLLAYTDHHLYHLAQGQTGARTPPGAPPRKAVEKKRKAKSKKRKAKPKKRKPKRHPRPKPRKKLKLRGLPG